MDVLGSDVMRLAEISEGSKVLVDWGGTMGSEGRQGMKKIAKSQHSTATGLQLFPDVDENIWERRGAWI